MAKINTQQIQPIEEQDISIDLGDKEQSYIYTCIYVVILKACLHQPFAKNLHKKF